MAHNNVSSGDWHWQRAFASLKLGVELGIILVYRLIEKSFCLFGGFLCLFLSCQSLFFGFLLLGCGFLCLLCSGGTFGCRLLGRCLNLCLGGGFGFLGSGNFLLFFRYFSLGCCCLCLSFLL
jgi:hypothetical protein